MWSYQASPPLTEPSTRCFEPLPAEQNTPPNGVRSGARVNQPSASGQGRSRKSEERKTQPTDLSRGGRGTGPPPLGRTEAASVVILLLLLVVIVAGIAAANVLPIRAISPPLQPQHTHADAIHGHREAPRTLEPPRRKSTGQLGVSPPTRRTQQCGEREASSLLEPPPATCRNGTSRETQTRHSMEQDLTRHIVFRREGPRGTAALRRMKRAASLPNRNWLERCNGRKSLPHPRRKTSAVRTAPDIQRHRDQQSRNTGRTVSRPSIFISGPLYIDGRIFQSRVYTRSTIGYYDVFRQSGERMARLTQGFQSIREAVPENKTRCTCFCTLPMQYIHPMMQGSTNEGCNKRNARITDVLIAGLLCITSSP